MGAKRNGRQGRRRSGPGARFAGARLAGERRFRRFPAMREVVSLATPPVRRIAPDGVFDAFGWCPSAGLEWGRRAGRARGGASEASRGSVEFDARTPITSANPPRMVFVMRAECTFL